MATTKKATDPNLDYTNQPQATSQQDVNNQDSRTRLWQSLDYSYGQQRRQTDKSYDQAKLSADNQALSRGMQRSSYNNAVLANLDKQKIDTSNNIYSQQIADYQNRLQDIEAAEQQQANWQAEFDANQAAQQWQQAFSEKQFETQKEQWKQEFDYNKMSGQQQLAYNYIMNMLETGDKPSDALLAQAGISRSDYEQMKATAVKSGGSRAPKNPGTTNPDAIPTGVTPGSTEALISAYNPGSVVKPTAVPSVTNTEGKVTYTPTSLMNSKDYVYNGKGKYIYETTK